MPRPNKPRTVGGNDRAKVRIKEEREARYWTRATLAMLVREQGVPMSAQTLGKIENASRQVNVNEIVAIADALGVSIDDLLLGVSST
jgi:transcriptional regulator with XRE-family HTH domain